jgi:phage baseplate assembly protein W
MNYVYSDMKPTLEITRDGNVSKNYDVDVIVQSIRTILATVSGERVRNPIGARVVRLLFEPMSDDLARRLRTEILETILRYEPRVSPDAFSVVPNYDNNSYEIYMLLRIEGIQRPIKEVLRLRSFATY